MTDDVTMNKIDAEVPKEETGQPVVGQPVAEITMDSPEIAEVPKAVKKEKKAEVKKDPDAYLKEMTERGRTIYEWEVRDMHGWKQPAKSLSLYLQRLEARRKKQAEARKKKRGEKNGKN